MKRAERHWRDELDVLDHIEGALTPEQHAGLREALRLAGVEPDAWLAVPALRQTYGLQAALNILHRFLDEGYTPEQAMGEAEMQLGIPQKTLETWLRRWREYAA